jgi:hypothetical protein
MPLPAEATLLVTYNTQVDVHVIDVVERMGGRGGRFVEVIPVLVPEILLGPGARGPGQVAGPETCHCP